HLMEVQFLVTSSRRHLTNAQVLCSFFLISTCSDCTTQNCFSVTCCAKIRELRYGSCCMVCLVCIGLLGTQALSRMICHWSWCNLHFSSTIAQVLADGIDELSEDEYKPDFTVLRQLLAIPDPLQVQRIGLVMVPFLDAVTRNREYTDATLA